MSGQNSQASLVVSYSLVAYADLASATITTTVKRGQNATFILGLQIGSIEFAFCISPDTFGLSSLGLYPLASL